MASAVRWVKFVHVAAAGVWLGALTGVLSALLLARAPRPQYGLILAAYFLNETVLTWAFVATLASGLWFSLFSPWGLVRHYWIIAKWALASALFALTLWIQAPAISGAVALADAGVAEIGGERLADFYRRATGVATVQLALVVAVFAISSLRPWGKAPWKWSPSRRLALGLTAGVVVVGGGLAAANWAMLRHVRTLPVPAASAAGLPDGVHRGELACGGFRYAVEIQTARERITEARAIANRDAHYARIAAAVLPRVVAAQTTRVDSITGATTTSRCLLRAAASALGR